MLVAAGDLKSPAHSQWFSFEEEKPDTRRIDIPIRALKFAKNLE
jgi:hypothetical protein